MNKKKSYMCLKIKKAIIIVTSKVTKERIKKTTKIRQKLNATHNKKKKMMKYTHARIDCHLSYLPKPLLLLKLLRTNY